MEENKNTVVIERTDKYELQKLVKKLDLWCIQHWGFPGPDNLWNRNRARFYERPGCGRRPRVYYTVYKFKEAEYVFEFKLAHM